MIRWCLIQKTVHFVNKNIQITKPKYYVTASSKEQKMDNFEFFVQPKFLFIIQVNTNSCGDQFYLALSFKGSRCAMASGV